MNRELGVSLGGATLAALAAGFLPFVGNDYFTGIGFTLLTWIALTEAWMLISGMAGYVSLGHVAFVGIGAYLAALSWQAFPDSPVPLRILHITFDTLLTPPPISRFSTAKSNQNHRRQ